MHVRFRLLRRDGVLLRPDQRPAEWSKGFLSFERFSIGAQRVHRFVLRDPTTAPDRGRLSALHPPVGLIAGVDDALHLRGIEESTTERGRAGVLQEWLLRLPAG